MGDMWVRAVPVAVAGCFARKGDGVTGNLKVPQPARRRRGVTLIEAVLYIAIALALIVGGLLFYQQASLQSRVNSVARTLSAALAEARTMTKELGSVSTPRLEELLYARGAIPAENWDATKPLGFRLVFPFANMNATFASNILANGRLSIQVTFRNLDAKLCARLIRSSPQGEMIFATNFDGGISNVRDDNPPQTIINIPKGFTPAQAAAACNTADLNKNGLLFAELIFRTWD
jgi:hypothetical protein